MGRQATRDAQSFFSERVEAYRASASHANRADLDRMLALLRPARGALAMDVATGGGHTARALREAGCRVVATDATRAMLAALRDEADARIACDAQALPIRDGALDVIASRIAPHHFPDLGRFVAEAARVLRPAGALYVFDLTSPEDARAAATVNQLERLRDPSHVRSYPPSAWRRALDRAGLSIEHFAEASSEFDLEPWLARARMPPERERAARELLATHDASTLGGYGLTAEGRMRVLRVELIARKA